MIARGWHGAIAAGVCAAIVLQIVDVTTHGYGRVDVNALLVTVAALLATGDRFLPQAPRASARLH